MLHLVKQMEMHLCNTCPQSDNLLHQPGAVETSLQRVEASVDDDDNSNNSVLPHLLPTPRKRVTVMVQSCQLVVGKGAWIATFTVMSRAKTVIALAACRSSGMLARKSVDTSVSRLLIAQKIYKTDISHYNIQKRKAQPYYTHFLSSYCINLSPMYKLHWSMALNLRPNAHHYQICP